MNKIINKLYKDVHSTNNYYETAWRGEMRSAMFLKLAKENGGNDITDLGCRDGYLNFELSKGKNLIGIDIDDNALKLYVKRHAKNKVKTINQDLNETLKIVPNSQDIVIAGELIEHLMMPALLVSEANRILRKGGVFIGSTPNAFRYDKRWELLLGNDPKSFSDKTHLQYFSYLTIKEILERDFDQVEIFSYAGNKLVKFLPKLISDGFIWRCTKK